MDGFDFKAVLRDLRIGFSCLVGWHNWKTDKHKTNAHRWRFCKHCGCRQRGSYDMMYGETRWENW